MAKPHSNRPHADFRTRHRDKAHADAHDQGAEQQAGPLPNLPLVPRNSPKLIASKGELAELLDHLRQSGSFAYDSEFIGELTYIPKLCVIQVASSQQVALIDPLAGLDLAPFWELIADPTVEKVVHAGQQDIEPVVRHLDRPAAHVFDTQIVAGFVGMAYPVSLSKLVLELLDVKLGKGLTFTHWDQRPLSASQLRYAADDVRYLPAVRSILGERLDNAGHGDWAVAECDALCEPDQYRFNPDTQVNRVRGSGSLHPKGLAILRELVIWRDTGARLADQPPRAFVKDEVLVDLSRSPAKNIEKLRMVRGLPRPVESQHGQAILDAIARGLAHPADDLPEPRHIEENPVERFNADALWATAQALCAGQGVDPAVVGGRQDMAEFWRLLSGGGDVDSHRLMQGWRRPAIGDTLIKLVAGQAGISLDWTDGRPGSNVRER